VFFKSFQAASSASFFVHKVGDFQLLQYFTNYYWVIRIQTIIMPIYKISDPKAIHLCNKEDKTNSGTS